MISIRRAAPFALFGLLGCGGDPADSISLVPVRGTITLNGAPMANAMVSFVPDVTNQSGTAGGDTTGPQGNYLARYRNRSGLAPGKYKVTITPGIVSPGSENVADAFKDDPFMAGEAVRAASASKASKKQEIKGEFDAEVSESASVLDFDVKAKGFASAPSGAASKR